MCRSKTLKSKGLVAEVRQILERFSGTTLIIESVPSGYKGESKVKLPHRWPHRRPSIEVCDPAFGKRTLFLYAEKPGAILRLLGMELAERGVIVA